MRGVGVKGVSPAERGGSEASTLDAGEHRLTLCGPTMPAGCVVMAAALKPDGWVELRDRWLNLPEWVKWFDEPVSGYSRTAGSRDEAATKAVSSAPLPNVTGSCSRALAGCRSTIPGDSAGSTMRRGCI